MSISIKEYNELRSHAELLQRKAERQAGARDEILKQLKRDFGCASIKEARTKLEKMQAKESALKEEFEAKLVKLQKKWKHLNE